MEKGPFFWTSKIFLEKFPVNLISKNYLKKIIPWCLVQEILAPQNGPKSQFQAFLAMASKWLLAKLHLASKWLLSSPDLASSLHRDLAALMWIEAGRPLGIALRRQPHHHAYSVRHLRRRLRSVRSSSRKQRPLTYAASYSCKATT